MKRRSIIVRCPEKCEDCADNCCAWVGKKVTDTKSLDAFIKHGGVFGRDAIVKGNKRAQKKKASSTSGSAQAGKKKASSTSGSAQAGKKRKFGNG